MTDEPNAGAISGDAEPTMLNTMEEASIAPANDPLTKANVADSADPFAAVPRFNSEAATQEEALQNLTIFSKWLKQYAYNTLHPNMHPYLAGVTQMIGNVLEAPLDPDIAKIAR